MTAYTKRLLIVVTADVAAQANTHAKGVDAAGGERTFTAGLSPTGQAPATHYWCSWAMRPAEDTDLRSRLAALVGSGKVRVYDGTTTTPGQVLQTLGLQPIGRSS